MLGPALSDYPEGSADVIADGKLAQEKMSDANVKEFASQMSVDHGEAQAAFVKAARTSLASSNDRLIQLKSADIGVRAGL